MTVLASADGSAHLPLPEEFELLETGSLPVSREMAAVAVRLVRDGMASVVGADRNATCHRVVWCAAGLDRVIVKAVRHGPQRTNPDMTFRGEAAILARLPAAGIDNAPRLIARVRAGMNTTC